MWQKIKLFIKGKSKADVIFLLIFFLFLFVPMSHIDMSKKSIFENRAFATWKPLFNNSYNINEHFGKDFDSWFGDRFCGRRTFIGIYNYIYMCVNGHVGKYILDKEQNSIYRSTEFAHKKIELIKANVASLYDLLSYCRDKKIKLYVLITPIRGDIYETKLAEKVVSLKKEKIWHNDFLNFIKDIKKESKIKIIYPYEEFKDISLKRRIYHANEHHWTDDGAYIAYLKLMQDIKSDFPKINTLQPDEFNYHARFEDSVFNEFFIYRDFCLQLALPQNLCKKIYSNKYRQYEHKNVGMLSKLIYKQFFNETELSYPLGADYRVLLIGTSNIENFEQFIGYTFKNVKKIRLNGVKGIKEEDEFKIMKNYEKEILDYKPDIMILCISYTNLLSLNKIFDKD
jgi:hypothetical protein